MSRPLEDAIHAMEEFLNTVNKENAPLSRERRSLHPYVIQTVHHLEEYLKWALDGSRLRGAHNLLTSDNPIWGWNVRKREKHQQIRLPEEEGEDGIVEALFLSHNGMFTVAEVRLLPGRSPAFERVRFDLFEPEDDDLKVEDLPHCIRTMYIATGQHLRQSDKTAEATSRIRRLADETVAGLLNYRRWGMLKDEGSILKIDAMPIAVVGDKQREEPIHQIQED